MQLSARVPSVGYPTVAGCAELAVPSVAFHPLVLGLVLDVARGVRRRDHSDQQCLRAGRHEIGRPDAGANRDDRRGLQPGREPLDRGRRRLRGAAAAVRGVVGAVTGVSDVATIPGCAPSSSPPRGPTPWRPRAQPSRYASRRSSPPGARGGRHLRARRGLQRAGDRARLDDDVPAEQVLALAASYGIGTPRSTTGWVGSRISACVAPAGTSTSMALGRRSSGTTHRGSGSPAVAQRPNW